jgi:hypothetical protein
MSGPRPLAHGADRPATTFDAMLTRLEGLTRLSHFGGSGAELRTPINNLMGKPKWHCQTRTPDVPTAPRVESEDIVARMIDSLFRACGKPADARRLR